MSWGSDVTAYNAAVNALTQFIVARDNNTPDWQMIKYSNATQAALDAISVQMSASIAPKMPKHHPSL